MVQTGFAAERADSFVNDTVSASGKDVGSLMGTRVFIVLLNAPYWGSERHMVTVADALKESGAAVRVAVCDWEFGGIRRALDAHAIGYDELDVSGKFTRHGGAIYVARMLRRAGATAVAVQRAARRFRATHIIVPDETNLLYSVPALVARGRARAWFVPANVPDSARRESSAIYRAMWRRVISPLFDEIVGNSRYTAASIEQILPEKRRVPVIPCALPLRDATDSDPAVDAIDPARTNLVYVGQIAAHKGVDRLLEAAAPLIAERDDVDLVLAGSSADAAFRSHLDGVVTRHAMANRVNFLGEIRDVPGLLRKAYIHVAPSICEESFGLTVLEAKAQSVPSVVFPSGALTETVHHLVDGYCCPDLSVQALRDGLRYYVDNPHRRSTAAARARESLEEYSREAFERRWVSLFGGTDGIARMTNSGRKLKLSTQS